MQLKRFSPLLLGALSLILFLLTPSVSLSDELDDLEDQLNQTQNKLESAESEKQKTLSELEKLEQLKQHYQSTLDKLHGSYTVTQTQLSTTIAELEKKETELTETNQQLSEFEEMLDKRTSYIKTNIRGLYMSESPTWAATLLSASNANMANQTLVYRGAVIADTRSQIKNLNQEIKAIQEIKQILEEIKTQLDADRENLIQQQWALQTQISSTEQGLSSAQSQQVNLQQVLIGIDQQISELTQKQKEILAKKAAAALASTSVGNIEVDQAAIEKSPPTDGDVYFSFWTYGYPHRVGMNQYGAYGRAKAGQSADTIVNAYYTGAQLTDWPVPDKIAITTSSGNREIDFENDYLMGIGEMPSCWGKPENKGLEALKAQAIAARTYALTYTNNGEKPICTTQQCQVYVGASKVSGQCGEYWQQAVEETRGQVITANGQPITAWYASTAGGFTLSAAEVWGSNRAYAIGISDLDPAGKAYDGPDHGDSPWYHKAWGDQPWLTFDQVTDLVNAALLPEEFNNQLDSLSASEIVQKLNQSQIEPVANLKSLEIIDQNGKPGANTAQVKELRAYYGEGKVASVTGSRFKFVFNLRSPGTDAIWTTRFDILTAAEL